MESPTVVANEPRADAKRNRAHILETARETFRTEGLEVSMAEVARRSEVGIATLFRHFPAKEQLITEVFRDPILECARLIDAALAPGEAFATFESVTMHICELQVHDIGFALVLVSGYTEDPVFADAVEQMSRSMQRLIAQATADGQLRDDVTLEHFIVLLTANAGLVALGGPDVEEHSRLLVATMLRSLRT